MPLTNPDKDPPASKRRILAPISRNKAKKPAVAFRSKAFIQEDDDGEEILTDEVPAHLREVFEPRVKLGGSLSSWFDEDAPEFDEEEESKGWELPWSNIPTLPSDTSSFIDVAATPFIATPVGDLSSLTPPRSTTSSPKKPAKAKAQPHKGKAKGRTKPAPKAPAVKSSKIDKTNQKAACKTVSLSSDEISPVSTTTLSFTSTLNGKPKTHFFDLSLEIRDLIYSYLLEAVGPIPVFRSWTQCAGRYRGDLDPSILFVCKQTYEEGIRTLYSSNIFQYQIRDDGVPVPEALNKDGWISPAAFLPPTGIEEQGKGGKRAVKRPKTVKKRTGPTFGRVGDAHRVIYLAKYAHLLKHVEIELESNRTENKYCRVMAQAIRLLGHGEGGLKTNLVSLRISLTPVQETVVKLNVAVQEYKVVNFFADPPNTTPQPTTSGNKRKQPESNRPMSIIGALRSLNRRLLHFTVYTPASRHLDMTLDMTTGVGDEYGEPYGTLLSHDILINNQRHETVATSLKAFNNLQFLLKVACTETDQAVKTGWWKEYGPKAVSEVRSEMEQLKTAREKTEKYRSSWYTGKLTQMREQGAYMGSSAPTYSMCVRGNMALPKPVADKEVEDDDAMDEDD